MQKFLVLSCRKEWMNGKEAEIGELCGSAPLHPVRFPALSSNHHHDGKKLIARDTMY